MSQVKRRITLRSSVFLQRQLENAWRVSKGTLAQSVLCSSLRTARVCTPRATTRTCLSGTSRRHARKRPKNSDVPFSPVDQTDTTRRAATSQLYDIFRRSFLRKHPITYKYPVICAGPTTEIRSRRASLSSVRIAFRSAEKRLSRFQ
jgi:hypothetical protein